MAIEKKNFTGGLNSDTEDRLVPNGDYRYALNIRASKSDGASEGAIENTKGNTLVNFDLPAGTNKVIGALDNIKDNTVFFFIYNSKSIHSIFEYDASTSTVVPVLQTKFLKFKYNKYINDAFIIGDNLFFNDRVNPPRSINVKRAKNYEYPQPLRESYLNHVVSAPGFPPEAEYDSDPEISTNNVRGKMFQFRYKFVYLDNEESAWSPISKTPLPKDESIYRPAGYYPLDLNNYIRITFDLSDDYVKKVKLAVREGNTGDFRLIEDFDKTKEDLGVITPTEWTYNFYNDEVLLPLDNDGATGMRLFDNVPLKADAISSIDGNKIAFGGITEGYDPVDIDMDIAVNQTSSVAIAATPSQVVLSNRSPHDAIYGVNNEQYRRSFLFSFLARNIGSGTYYLDYGNTATRANNDPGNVYVPNTGTTYVFDSNVNANVWQNWETITQPNYPAPPALPIKDRAMIITFEPGGSRIRVGDSIHNEFIVYPPAGAGTRYVVSCTIYYYKLGSGNAKTSKTVRVQYTSQSGDNQDTVAQALQQKIQNLQFVDDLVKVRFSNTQSRAAGQWSWGADRPLNSGEAMVRVWGEAFVPPENVGGDAWPNTAGKHTGCVYNMKTTVETYGGWTLSNKKSLKTGASHGFGIVYYDEANRSGLTNIKDKKVYVPFFTERAGGIPSGYVPDETTVSLTIKHDPPEWADKYQIVYTGNQTIENLPAETGYKGFLQFRLKFVNNNTVPNGSPTAVNASIINVTQYNNNTPEDIDLGYSFSKGDRMRFITTPIGFNGTPGSYRNGDYKDVEIISFDSSTGVMQFKDPGLSDLEDSLVEIYTPRKSSDSLIYNEIGECYPIINGKHTGNNQDQTDTLPAIVDLDDVGDVYLRYRTFPISNTVESYSYSDFYKSDTWNKGRPNKVDDQIEQIKRPSTIRYSNAFVPETNINGLSRFDDFSFETYDEQYGDIQRMYSSDKNLIVLQDLKVGKVRIGQTTLYGNEGSTVATVKSQNKVLSDIVYYSGEYGIGRNPESFTVYGNRMYFVDTARGVVLRLSVDGLTPISEYQMHNYFTDTFGKLISDNGDYKIFGEYDVRFDEYVISIQGDITWLNVPEQVPDVIVTPGDGTSLSLVGDGGNTSGIVSTSGTITLPIEEANPNALKETIAFSERKKRWCTFYSYVPDYMVTNNVYLISFKDGNIYKHNDNSLYNNFYGEQGKSKVRLISNIEPSIIKVYNSMFIESNLPWAVPSIKNQFGQKSSLVISDFVDDEGVYKSSFLKDENTPNVELPLIEGDDLRCHSMEIELESGDTSEVKAFAVGINLTPSQLTNR